MASPLFSNYLIVDWSAASEPRTGADSIWYSFVQVHRSGRWIVETANPDTRIRAFHEIRQRLRQSLASAAATLVGFDFPLGYPRGFTAALGRRPGQAPWHDVWKSIASVIVDRDDNANNRFEAASRLNQSTGAAGAGPFWGRPASHSVPGLAARKPKPEAHGLPEMRLADSWQSGPQSPWKLYTIGSVGSQALTGIPYVKRLREDGELEAHTRVWPFETGLAAPFGWRSDQPRVILAEVWPSLLRPLVPEGQVKDQAQVEALAQHFARLDRAGRLARLFAGPRELDKDQRDAVESEEGWILGVL